MHNIEGVRIKEKPGFEKSVFLALMRMPSLIVGRLLSARQAKILPKGACTVLLFKPNRNVIYWPLIALKCSPWKDKIESPSLGALGYLKQSQYGIWKQDLSNCWKMHQILPCFTLNVKAWHRNRLNVCLFDLSYCLTLLGCYNTYPSPRWPPS